MKTLLLLSAAVVMGLGGYFVYNHYTSNSITLIAGPANQITPNVTISNAEDPELIRRRLEGIGSIDKLHHVDIPPYEAKK